MRYTIARVLCACRILLMLYFDFARLPNIMVLVSNNNIEEGIRHERSGSGRIYDHH
jgi:hypothetical protein